MDLSSISSTANARMGTFEVNAKEFGPVVATAIGAAQAMGQAVSDSYSFSAQGLQSLADEGEQLVDAIAQAGSDVADWVGSAVDTVEDAASTVTEEIGSFAGNVAAYVGMGAAALSQGIDEVI